MRNKTLKITSLILIVLTAYTSCDFSSSSSSLDNFSSNMTTETYTQIDSEYWNYVFEDFWDYMNVNYVYWDMEEDKDGEYQEEQTETDWDEIYSTYSEKFEALEDKDDLVTRNEYALTYFQELTSTLIDHHYYMYLKSVILTDDDSPSGYSYYNISLTTPGQTEVSTRDYYNEDYVDLDFSEYNYYTFESYDSDIPTTAAVATAADDDDDSSSSNSASDAAYLMDGIYIYPSDFEIEDSIDVATALEIIEAGDDAVATDDSDDSSDDLGIDEDHLPSTITDNLSNVEVCDTSEYSSSSDYVIISALFDSDEDGNGDTPYLYMSNFYNTLYESDTNVTDVMDNFWALVYNTNGTGEVSKIIIDLRHNTGGYVADLTDVVGPLISEDESITYGYTRYKDGDNRTDYTPLIENKVTGTATSDDDIPDVPIIVLADIYSVSMSDIAILALKAIGGDDTILMGQRTWGGNGPLVSTYFLDGTEDNDYYYVYTSANAMFDVDGISYEGVGITPDDGYDVADIDTFDDDSGISTVYYEADSDGNISSWGNDLLLVKALQYDVDLLIL
jgi:hypothetical protein